MMLASSSARSHLFTAFSPVIPNRVHALNNRFSAGQKVQPGINKSNSKGQVKFAF